MGSSSFLGLMPHLQGAEKHTHMRFECNLFAVFCCPARWLRAQHNVCSTELTQQLAWCSLSTAHRLLHEMRMGIIRATMGVLLMNADANMIGTIMRTCSTINMVVMNNPSNTCTQTQSRCHTITLIAVPGAHCLCARYCVWLAAAATRPLLHLVLSVQLSTLLVFTRLSGRPTCAQKTVLALPRTMFMARSSPPVCVTPSATRYSVITVSTPVLLKPAGQQGKFAQDG